MSARVTYTLKHALYREHEEADGSIREEEIRAAGSELFIRRLRGVDIDKIDLDGDQVAMAFELIARLTRLPVDQVKLLDLEDFACLGEVMEGFLPVGLLEKLSKKS